MGSCVGVEDVCRISPEGTPSRSRGNGPAGLNSPICCPRCYRGKALGRHHLTWRWGASALNLNLHLRGRGFVLFNHLRARGGAEWRAESGPSLGPRRRRFLFGLIGGRGGAYQASCFATNRSQQHGQGSTSLLRSPATPTRPHTPFSRVGQLADLRPAKMQIRRLKLAVRCQLSYIIFSPVEFSQIYVAGSTSAFDVIDVARSQHNSASYRPPVLPGNRASPA